MQARNFFFPIWVWDSAVVSDIGAGTLGLAHYKRGMSVSGIPVCDLGF